MKLKFISLLAVVFLTVGTSAQSKFWDNLRIRKAFETQTDDDDKAANLSFTFPKDTNSSFVINAGVGYSFGHFSKTKTYLYKHSFTGFFVYNQNTEIDEEQKNYKSGMTFNQVFYTNTEQTTAFFLEHTSEYLRDYYDSSHSLILTSYLHPLSKKPSTIKFGGYAQTAKKTLFYLLPQVGIEYQNTFKAKKSTEQGYNFRGYFSFGGNLLFKKKTYDEDKKAKKNALLEPEYWTKGIELKVTYMGRVDIANNIAETESYIPLFKAEIVFYPTQDNKFTIGLSYNDGANPLDGIAKQTYWLLALKFKK